MSKSDSNNDVLGPKSDLVRIAAAVLLHIEELTQKEIGRILHVAEATVNVDLQRARKAGLLKTYVDIPSHVKEDAEFRIQAGRITNALRDATGSMNLQNVVLCQGPNPRSACAARAVADLPMDLKGMRLGVAWGLAVLELTHCLEARRHSLIGATFVPVCGDPLALPMPRPMASASSISNILNVASKSREWKSMSGVPAFFPELPADVLQKCKQAFGVDRPSRDKLSLDGLFTGIGHNPLGYDGDMLVASTGISRTLLNSVAIGDLAGVLLPREGLSPDEGNILRDVRKRWTGLQSRDLKLIAGRDLGVFVLATSEEKFDALLAAIRLDMVTRAYVTQDLFDKLKLFAGVPSVSHNPAVHADDAEV